MSKCFIELDIYDVKKSGSVRNAIIEASKNSSDSSWASGVIKTYDGSKPTVDDYARASFAAGAMSYMDADDGRVCHIARPDSTSSSGDEVWIDQFGKSYIVGEWSSFSEVRLVCPSADEALENIDVFVDMAQSLIDHHIQCSDMVAWNALIEAIQKASEKTKSVAKEMANWP